MITCKMPKSLRLSQAGWTIVLRMQLDGENGVPVPGLGLFWLESQVRSIPRPYSIIWAHDQAALPRSQDVTCGCYGLCTALECGEIPPPSAGLKRSR